MKILQQLSVATLLISSLQGCQCCRLTEKYQDVIDVVASRQGHLDHWYCPALDLTRIGYPDWCACPLNRCLYGDCCCRDSRQQPPYIHNPMYFPPSHPPSERPIPEGPQISPRFDVGPDEQGLEKVPTELRGTPDPKQLEEGDSLPPLPPVPESSAEE